MADDIDIRSLILAGGQSSRMGSPKYLLPFPLISRTIPLILQTLLLHVEAAQMSQHRKTHAIAISVRGQAQKREIEHILKLHPEGHSIQVDFVFDMQPERGPIMGLMAANTLDGEAHWMVTGCDYPMLQVNALLQLSSEHRRAQNAITCFRNAEGYTEPLLAIWSPYALKRLHQMASADTHLGPNRVVKAFADDGEESAMQPAFSTGVQVVSPHNEQWLKSVDTKAEWDEARKDIRARVAAAEP